MKTFFGLLSERFPQLRRNGGWFLIAKLIFTTLALAMVALSEWSGKGLICALLGLAWVSQGVRLWLLLTQKENSVSGEIATPDRERPEDRPGG